MVQSLQFGPLAVPTAPLFAVLAVMIGVDMAARYGRRLGLHADDVWNTGMIAIVAGLIVARLWNVLHFWDVYLEEPGLIFSLRPSGFVWSAGLIAALIAGYGWMIVRSLDPLRVATALLVGGTVGWIVQSMSNFLTGNPLGLLSNLPWAVPYYDELRHPVALYELAGATVLWLFVMSWGRRASPSQTFWGLLLGWGVLLLLTRAFVEEPVTMLGLRTVQVVALVIGLFACWRLATSKSVSQS
ncbi:MAG: prolipoprotein diacylglyceryl transferase family protein [Caldilineaceae bacterium]